MEKLQCPCGQLINIEFDAGERQRQVPCFRCYRVESWAEQDPNGEPGQGITVSKEYGKVLLLHSNGLVEVLEDYG